MDEKKNFYMFIGVGVVVIPLIICGIALFMYNRSHKPEDKLTEYVNLINAKDYEKMYELTDGETKKTLSKDDFVARNKNIYEGIEASDIKVEVNNVEKKSNEATINYDTSMNTLCGELKFSNTLTMTREIGKDYTIKWNSKAIFPDLSDFQPFFTNTSFIYQFL